MSKALKGTIFIGLKIVEIIAFLLFNWLGYYIGSNANVTELKSGVVPTLLEKIAITLLGDFVLILISVLIVGIIFLLYHGILGVIRKNLEWADKFTNNIINSKLLKNKQGGKNKNG